MTSDQKTFCPRASAISANIFVWLSGLIIVAAGIALAFLSRVSYPSLKSRIDLLAADGHSSFFTETYWQDLGTRLFTAAIITTACGGTILFLSPKLADHLSQLTADLKDLVEAQYHRIRTGLQTPDGFLTALALFLLTGAGTLIRWHYSGIPVRMDEAFTYTNFVSKPLYVALSFYEQPNNHLFHTMLAWISIRLLGDTEWSLRLPALLAGTAAIPMAYATGAILFNRTAGIMAAGIMAVAPEAISYSANARGYSLLGLFTLFLAALAPALVVKPRPTHWAFFVIVSALGLWTVPVMLFPVSTVTCWILWTAMKRGVFRKTAFRLGIATATAGLIAAVLYSPAILAMGSDAVMRNRWVSPHPPEVFIPRSIESIIATGEQWTMGVPNPAIWLFGTGVLLSLLPSGRNDASWTACIIIASILLIVTKQVAPPVRSWHQFQPLLAVVSAGGWMNVNARFLAIIPARLVLTLAGAIVLWTGYSVLRSDAPLYIINTGIATDTRGIVDWLKPRLSPEDRIIQPITSAPGFFYYCRREGIDRMILDEASYESAETLWIVEIPGFHTLQDLLGDRGISIAGFSPPAMMKEFPDYHPAILWRMDRLKDFSY